jgi:predicted TIM-barrel fold metal-dependent hydrolase
MLIVDAQVHIWSSGPPTTPFHRQVQTFSADELLAEMDAAGVDAAIVHPPSSWDPHANDLAIQAARSHPQRLAILGNFPIDKPESRTLVANWKDQPGMLGLRFVINQTHQRTWWTDGTMDWLWPAAEQADVPIAVLGDHLGILGQVAERHPRLKLIVDHLGRDRHNLGQGDAGFANLSELLALARYPNVAIKATGAPGFSAETYPYRDIHPHLRQMYEAFGAERMFWGTDITRMPCTWRQCITMFTEELTWLSDRDKELTMGRAVCDWLEWQPSVDSRSN